MDPITFATIVQLIALFVQERRSTKEAKREHFLQWLDQHRFQHLKDAIAQTHYLSDEVDKLLLQDHQIILGKLEEMSSVLGSVVHHIEVLSGLGRSQPKQGLSVQAVEILTLFVEEGFTALYGKGRFGTYFLPGPKTINGIDERFLDDDLTSLVCHGLLLEQPSDDGVVYKLTRAGNGFVAATKSH